MIKRFLKKQGYIGINFKRQNNITGNFEDSLSITVFNGKPYNRCDYDDIILWSVDNFDKLCTKIEKQAKKYNRNVIMNSMYAYQIPIYIHS